MMISRRAVLRGIGVTMALPWMESVDAFGAGRTTFPKRFAVLFMGNGISGNDWWAKGSGAAMTLGRSLTPLEPLKHKVNIVNGLFNKEAVGKGIHPAQTGNLLSGAPLAKGDAVRATVTIDQVLADRIGRGTPQPSLALSCEPALSGCDATQFSLAYSSHISWRSATRPASTEICPAAAFDCLFESRGHLQGRSVIDRIRDRAAGLNRSISNADRSRLDAYLTSVRELEQRVEPLRGATARTDDIRERAHAMGDIIALAFQAGRTRVASLILARDLSSLTYPFLGVRDDHHRASHDDLSDGYESIVRFHVSQLAALAARLDAMPEGDGTVLDHSCLLWLSNMWSGWKHDNMKLPVVTVGGLGGTIATGRTLEYLYGGDERRKLCSLYLSIADRMGVTLDRFGDADTRLEGF